MELAGQLSFISVGIGIIMVILGLVKYFKQRAAQNRMQAEDSPESNEP
ncbi:MAG: hypothetical protein OXH26_02500 [bacterium]|nr:hypothetical protein [bacterium]MDE0674812.1 hypothetical protein [bacterium]